MFEVVAFVNKDVLPSLGAGGWAGFGSLERMAALVGYSHF